MCKFVQHVFPLSTTPIAQNPATPYICSNCTESYINKVSTLQGCRIQFFVIAGNEIDITVIVVGKLLPIVVMIGPGLDGWGRVGLKSVTPPILGKLGAGLRMGDRHHPGTDGG